MKLQKRKGLAILSVLTLVISLVFTMGVSADDATTPTNLLTTNSKLSIVSIAHPDKMIWDDTYNYGDTVTDTGAATSTYLSTLVDGNTATYAGGAQICKANTEDEAVSRRLAYYIDLGTVCKLTDITITSPNTFFCVLDYSVYGSVTSPSSDVTTATKALLNDSNKIGHFSTTDIDGVNNDCAFNLTLSDGATARYLLIVLNKMSTDYGNSNHSTSGTYGANPLPGHTSPKGGLGVSELEIFGETSTDLFTANSSIAAYRLSGDFSNVWDMTFGANTFVGTQAKALDFYNGGTKITSEAAAAVLVNGTRGYTNAESPAISYSFGETADLQIRRALLVDLGGARDLDSICIDMAGQYVAPGEVAWHALYDCSVYAGNTSDPAQLATAQNFVYNYTTEEKNATAKFSLYGAKNVRYVLITFNKHSYEWGSTGSDTEGKHGVNHLPTTRIDYKDAYDQNGASLFKNPDSKIYLTELSITGWEAAAVVEPDVPEEPEVPAEPVAPVANGATINSRNENALKFYALLPGGDVPTGYTVSEYGILVIPSQFLPGGSNEKDGAALEFGNRYVLTERYEIAAGYTFTPNEEFSAELIGAGAGVYPGVKFSTCSYVIYKQDGTENSVVKYSETKEYSVWRLARKMATEIFKAKEDVNDTRLNGIVLDFEDTGVPEEGYTAALAEVATSTTDVTMEELYKFVCKNIDAVAAVAPN